MDQGWPAPHAAGPVDAAISLPGSKSVTNRALVLAALANGPSAVRRPLRSRDTQLMASALTRLGAAVDTAGDDTWRVRPMGRPAGDPVDVGVGNAGTVLRFTPPLAALGSRPVAFDGDPAVRRRPVGPLLGALRQLGARIDGDAAPFTVHGAGGVPGGTVSIDASTSSQFVSALLLAAPAFDRGLVLRHAGARPVPNAPHLAMTVEMLRARGVTVAASADGWRVEAGPIAARDEVVEPDLSTAAPLLAAAVATGGRVAVDVWPHDSRQPGGRLPEILRAFGASVERAGDGLVVRGGGPIEGVDLDLRDAGELTPVVAALAAVASGPSQLSGVDYLRGHETDRLAALARELGSLGAEVTETGDGLRVVPKPLHGGRFASYDDHRMVMAGAVVGAVVPGVVLDDVATVGKTFPDFPRVWSDLVATAGGAS